MVLNHQVCADLVQQPEVPCLRLLPAHPWKAMGSENFPWGLRTTGKAGCHGQSCGVTWPTGGCGDVCMRQRVKHRPGARDLQTEAKSCVHLSTQPTVSFLLPSHYRGIWGPQAGSGSVMLCLGCMLFSSNNFSITGAVTTTRNY